MSTEDRKEMREPEGEQHEARTEVVVSLGFLASYYIAFCSYTYVGEIFYLFIIIIIYFIFFFFLLLPDWNGLTNSCP